MILKTIVRRMHFSTEQVLRRNTSKEDAATAVGFPYLEAGQDYTAGPIN